MKKLLQVSMLIISTFITLNAFAQDADTALALLKEGNERFVAMKVEHPNISVERRADAAVKEHRPFAIVLACSDSRVPVEAIFDRGIGDIFVVRVAGNIATDPSVIGSIEYAAEHLKSPLLVIMGHTGCGAVKAAISEPPLEGDIRAIQKTIELAAEKVKKEQPSLKEDDLISAAVKENVFQAEKSLLSKSEEARELTEKGRLKIVAAIYDLKTGAVEWL